MRSKPGVVIFSAAILGTGLIVVLLALLSLPAAAGGEDGQDSLSLVGHGLPGAGVEDRSLDPRWAQLILEEGAHGGSRVPTGVPSINVNLTTAAIAGLTDSPLPINITATRGVTVHAALTVDPVPIDQVYLYQTSLVCSSYDTGCYTIAPEDVIWVKQGGGVVSMTIPVLSATAEAATDRVYGEAPPNDPVTVFLFPAETELIYLTQTIAADGAGAYQTDWAPEHDLVPPDDGYARHAVQEGRAAYVQYIAPLLRAEAYGLEVAGKVTPNTSFQLEVRDPGGKVVYRRWAYSEEDGFFSDVMNSYWGLYDPPPAVMTPGFLVYAIADSFEISMTVAEVTAHADLAGNQVTGTAPAHAEVEFWKMAGPYQNRYDTLWSQDPFDRFTTTVSGGGLYTITSPLIRGNYGAVSYRDGEGMQTFQRFTTPYLWVRMGRRIEQWRLTDYLFTGQLEAPTQRVTVEIQGPSGYLKDFFQLPTAYNGYFENRESFYQVNHSFDGGDVIAIRPAEGPELSVLLPQLTAEVDREESIVHGEAPAGAELTVWVFEVDQWTLPPYPPPIDPNVPGPLERIVTAGPDGTYEADFSALGGVPPFASGVVMMTMADGNEVVRTFESGSTCPPELLSAQVGGSRVNFGEVENCPEGIIRLRNPGGVLKAEIIIDPWPHHVSDFFRSPEGLVKILPGDTIEVEMRGETLSWVVPNLTVDSDWEGDVVQGVGPAGEVLQVYVETSDFLTNQFGIYTTTVGAQGTYSLSLTGLYDLVPGSRVEVSQIGVPPRYYAVDLIHLLRTRINGSEVSGVLDHGSVYTLTVLSGGDIFTRTGFVWDDSGYFNELLYFEDEENWEYLQIQPGDEIVIAMPGTDLAFTVPRVSAHLDKPQATVSGEAPPYSPLSVYLEHENGGSVRKITSTITGTYSAAFPELTPIFGRARGDIVHSNQDGYQTTLWFAARHFDITLGSSCALGAVDRPGDVLTLTYRTPDGSYTEVQEARSNDFDGAFFVCFERILEPGNELVLDEPSGSLNLEIPLLTAHYDAFHDVVEGLAVPNGLVEFEFRPIFGTKTRHVIAGPDGTYGIDTSDMILDLHQMGTMTVTDREGNLVRLDFIQAGQDYLPMIYWGWQD